jgi:hypothetical protein
MKKQFIKSFWCTVVASLVASLFLLPLAFVHEKPDILLAIILYVGMTGFFSAVFSIIE